MTHRPSRPELTLYRFLAVNVLVSLGFGLAMAQGDGSLASGLLGFALAFTAFQIVWLVLLLRTARADGRDMTHGSRTRFGVRESRARAGGPGVGRSPRHDPSKP